MRAHFSMIGRIFYFNSIKVRLEQDLAKEGYGVLHEFQFHKGTIRTLGNFYQFQSIGISIP